jgi:LmbE family N-acetylglucosaminyl deacetylase
VRHRSFSVGPTLLILFFLLASPLWGQLEPPSTGGAVALDQELRMLGHYKRVLMIGAHPDDEDTELLTVLVRGMGVEAGYLSLNRGEGGQNLIGPELGEALGLLRTEELLAARRLDGARQYFTRAYDFGYSKSLEETWRHWPRDTILKDVVRIVRRFRPQIIVSIFSGTPRDGHGQHQAAGWSAQEAFRVAGDSSQFRELFSEEGLVPWSPLKLYRSTRFDSTATTLTLNGGVLDPVVGKSYHQIAMAGRSLHRSQDMGQLQRIGPSKVRLALVEDRTSGGGAGLFAGIDTTMVAMPLGERRGGGAAELIRATDQPELNHYAGRIDSVMAARGNLPRQKSLLARAANDLERAVSTPPQAAAGQRGVYYTRGIELEDQLGHLNAAAWHLGGVVFDVVLDDDRVVVGQLLRWTLISWNASDQPRIANMRAAECIPLGECRSPDQGPSAKIIQPNQVDTASVDYQVLDQPPTTPYFLMSPRAGDLYRWPEEPDRARVTGSLPYGEPFESPTFLGSVEVNAGESDSLGASRLEEAVFRFNDQARGEVRRPVFVVPRVDVKLDPSTELWPLNSAIPHRFTVTLTHGGRDSTSGTVGLRLPRGWAPVPPQQFRFTREDERATFAFDVRSPPKLSSGNAEIRAIATDAGGTTYDLGVFTVDYPHIRPRSYTKPATAALRIASLALPRLTRVGYIRGAADQVPEALTSVGVPVTLLGRRTLERGNLGRYDAIIVGPRAYETDSDLVENNHRLLEYARRGGLVIVQYQQHRFFNGRFAPYPMKVGGQPLRLDDAPAGRVSGTAPPRSIPPISHDRVTNENAPMRILAADHPLVRVPNRLGTADWKGWVQERGLYFARSWDRRYRPILETHDPGEPPLAGGLLIVPVGKGTYVYTGLSFFRQLPAGVPGAFRLFANLLALAR